MRTTIRTEAEKSEFIKFIVNTDIKSSYRAEFTKIQRKRSLSANAYFWLCVTIGSQETGNDKMDLYYYFLDKYPTTKEIEISDEICIVPISSSAFNVTQMRVLTDNVIRELNMMGIAIPEIDEEIAIEAYNFYREKGLI